MHDEHFDFRPSRDRNVSVGVDGEVNDDGGVDVGMDSEADVEVEAGIDFESNVDEDVAVDGDPDFNADSGPVTVKELFYLYKDELKNIKTNRLVSIGGKLKLATSQVKVS